ncbi:MAG: hypothetical protein DSY55_03050 [Clostridia bacterium]|nr:MAG: hypothetical protein DSY55_03050 [Clostridia bacterium]
MNSLSRRNFLKALGAAGLIGASHSLFPGWTPRLAFAADRHASADRDILVNIFLRGGMDGLSAVIPYAEGRDYYDNRPTLAVPEPGGGPRSAIDLDGYFGLHPALAPLKEIYDQKDLAIIHASGLVHPTRSHFDAQHFIEYGIPGDKTGDTGWIGRHLASAAWRNSSPFRVMGLSDLMSDSLRGPVPALAMHDIADFHFRGRSDTVADMKGALASLYAAAGPHDILNQQAKMVFESVSVMERLAETSYQPDHNAIYPEDDEGFGAAMKQIAQIIKADIGLEVASLDAGGWDTHEAQGTLDGYLDAQFELLARGLSAFYADMGDAMRRITLVVMSEFGRTIDENGSQGTDHGHGNAMFILGGGVQGGQVFGRWPTLAPEARDDSDDLAITTDYRDVLAEMLQRRLGNNAIDIIFPGFTPQTLNLFTNH